VQHSVVARCSRQLTGPANWFLRHWDPYGVLNLEAVALVHIVTQWSGSGGTEAYLSGQLASFSALTLFTRSSGR